MYHRVLSLAFLSESSFQKMQSISLHLVYCLFVQPSTWYKPIPVPCPPLFQSNPSRWRSQQSHCLQLRTTLLSPVFLSLSSATGATLFILRFSLPCCLVCSHLPLDSTPLVFPSLLLSEHLFLCSLIKCSCTPFSHLESSLELMILLKPVSPMST